MQAELRAAADEFRAAPDRLKAAIYKAADTPNKDGKLPTALEIAQAADFVYNPDYVRKLVSQYRARKADGASAES